MKKVVYSVSRYRKDEIVKLTGLGYITDTDLIIACVSQKGKPYMQTLKILQTTTAQDGLTIFPFIKTNKQRGAGAPTHKKSPLPKKRFWGDMGVESHRQKPLFFIGGKQICSVFTVLSVHYV